MPVDGADSVNDMTEWERGDMTPIERSGLEARERAEKFRRPPSWKVLTVLFLIAPVLTLVGLVVGAPFLLALVFLAPIFGPTLLARKAKVRIW